MQKEEEKFITTWVQKCLITELSDLLLMLVLHYTSRVWLQLLPEYCCWDPTFFRTGMELTDFMQNILPDYTKDMPSASRQQMFLMHQGAPVHFSHSARRHLDSHYPCWIGRGWPIAWPSHSPNLNSLDFYLWGRLKSLVYAPAVHDEQTLHARIMAACETVALHWQFCSFSALSANMSRGLYSGRWRSL